MLQVAEFSFGTRVSQNRCRRSSHPQTADTLTIAEQFKTLNLSEAHVRVDDRQRAISFPIATVNIKSPPVLTPSRDAAGFWSDYPSEDPVFAARRSANRSEKTNTTSKPATYHWGVHASGLLSLRRSHLDFDSPPDQPDRSYERLLCFRLWRTPVT